ncbi:cyclopropane fatty-acyl-phospholipid synthase-like methyltransferase [Saccharothrix carnea]|uniref:Cyclopropane fatty-acyl-phospholipid synthase-like methyltransferase n=1 Tax=Saccharothrix carnea TaxID=1280637 RepID=A0A2P8IAW8_SACCR|nr:class I SAM-dependent methyltransferase [Saccharothrix carnea]PSL55598.1 cyclopropane fatty-acyl-phospholipid synthase-like methyltransferase [Saccharothrix carnea]
MGDLTEVRRVYGTGDLAALPVFAGGFINFGYWAGIPLDGDLTVEQRVASQEALYDLVVDALGIGPGHRVLEVGSGRGLGARRVLRRDPALVRGVDLVPEQVARAREVNDDPRVAFVQGACDDLPFPDASFDALLSVEAAQHFEDVAGFARESARVLVPGGRFAVTTFFTRTRDAGDALAEVLRTFATGLDRAHLVDDVVRDLRAAGFADVTALSIGEHVWRGLDRWLELGPRPDRWDRNWLRAVERGLVDYYLVTARKPAGSGV